MIKVNIKMFKNLLKQCNVSYLWIIIIVIRIFYDDFILFQNLQFNNNTFIIINDIDNRVILVFYFDNGSCNINQNIPINIIFG